MCVCVCVCVCISLNSYWLNAYVCVGIYMWLLVF